MIFFSLKLGIIFLKKLDQEGSNHSEQFKIRIIVINLKLKLGSVQKEDPSFTRLTDLNEFGTKK